MIKRLPSPVLYELVLVALLSIGIPASSTFARVVQWESPSWYVVSQISNTSGINDVTFLDASDGWAVGGGGGLFFTHDGGQTWTIKSTGIADDFVSIAFSDAQHGFILAQAMSSDYPLGVSVLHTSDGGASWQQVSLCSCDHIGAGSLAVASPTTVYATLSNGNLLGSNDGGNTWHMLFGVVGTQVVFANATEGWLLSGSSIYHTTDGANTWTAVLTTNGNAQSIAVPAPGQIVADSFATAGDLYRSSDDGATWSDSPLSVNLQSFVFTSPSQGLGMDPLSVYTTADGGVTWQNQPLPNNWRPQLVGYRDSADPFVVANSSLLAYGTPPAPTATSTPMPSNTPVLANTPVPTPTSTPTHVPPSSSETVATDTPTPQDTSTALSLMELSRVDPSTVIAQSNAHFAIQGTGFDEQAIVSIGGDDLSARDVQFMMSDDGSSLLVTVPHTITPGVYDVMVSEPDGTSATLPHALTVLRRLTLGVHQQARTVHPGSSIVFQVMTLTGASLRVRVLPQQRHAHSHATLAIVNQGHGKWHVTVAVNRHDPLGTRHVTIEARLGAQVLQQTRAFQVIRR